MAHTDQECNECVSVVSSQDVVVARSVGREVARKLGFSVSEATLVATAISELARNIVTYARCGEIQISLASTGTRRGINIVAHDEGPGIEDIGLAMRQGYSTVGGLGIGLPGVRRIMDEFAITSGVEGTTVTTTKWKS